MRTISKAHAIIVDILNNSKKVVYLEIPKEKLEELNKYIAELEREKETD